MIALTVSTFCARLLIGVLFLGPSVVLIGGIFFAHFAHTAEGRDMSIHSNNQETKQP